MKVAMLGLGSMGRRMVQRLVGAGVEVRTWNRTPRSVEGAETMSTPAAAAAGADVVVSMVTHDEASHEVWHGRDGALQGLRAGALAVECSTVTPAHSQALAQAVREAGGRYVEAPVVGTRPHAEQGTLTVLVGGNDPDAAEAIEAFAPWGRVVHVGAVGSAMTLKLAINSMFATEVVMLAEALAVLRKAGMSTEQGLSALEGLPVFPPILGAVAALIRADNDAPMFPVALVEKDLGYAAGLGELPLFDAVRDRYGAACRAELGDRNIHAVHHLYTSD